MRHHDITIREATDDDYLDLVEVVMSCFAEYTNCVMDIDGEIPERICPAPRISGDVARYRVADWRPAYGTPKHVIQSECPPDVVLLLLKEARHGCWVSFTHMAAELCL